ncbi:MAG: dTMP kinase [Alphaproteobacteria bacterium]|nr:dTMP kinase [Alphaproteobacteria bacterium]MDA8000687.1 dTMP kinase [Alphaproteobacteria bacterium]MDA8004584.1 dTMP kinase [Alphaproteobacteria bacterium]MDA8005981.1 dTMP kinase [Alphaproteobacteria bacterium]MDA8013357.1 dTMP kinase [Alphaproteobacteria bacterium]
MPPQTQTRRRPRRGRLIVFEGIDGTGKTTQAKFLERDLRRAGHPCIRSHEPGGTKRGAVLRDLLLHPPRGRWRTKSETFLFLADRHEHVQSVILPALERGQHVVLDRFTHSTLAFQGYGGDLTLRERGELSLILKFATDGLVPDLVILLDMPARDALARVRRRGDARTDFEKRGAPRNEKIRRGFLSIARGQKKGQGRGQNRGQNSRQSGSGEKTRFVVLDADQDEKVIRARVWEAVAPLL